MQVAGTYPTSVLLYYVILWQNITIVFPVISYYFGEKMFQLCKMQIACLIMLIFSGLNYIREGKGQVCNRYFDWVFILAEITVFFDGFSVVTVNYLVISHRSINVFIHFMFLASLDAFFYMVFIYFLSLTGVFGKSRLHVVIRMGFLPVVVLSVALCMPYIHFVRGTFTNYSMGLPVYFSYACVGALCVATSTILVVRYKFIRKSSRITLICCVITFCLFSLLQFNLPECLTSSLGITLLVFACYIILEFPAKKDLRVLRHFASIQKSYYDRLDQIEKIQSIYRHDTKHYLGVLAQLCSEKKTEEMEVLLRQMNSDLQKITPKTFSSSRIINALFNEKESSAQNVGVKIDFNVEINVDLSFIKDTDIISMFGNLIDNAVRAAKENHDEDRIVYVQLFETDGNFIMFTVENKFSGEIIRSNEKYISTKKNESGVHGLGLESSERLASKYGGFLDLDVDEEKKIWLSSLSIQKNYGDMKNV